MKNSLGNIYWMWDTSFMVYGQYGYDSSIKKDDLQITFIKEIDFVRYTRDLGGSVFKQSIASDSGDVYINPVEPVNLPQVITTYLEIRFDSIIIEPDARRQIYLTFPIEIGVFIFKGDTYRCIDIFSRTPQKYSLYGSIETGVITRYYKSQVNFSQPQSDPGYEGIIKLEIINTTKEWVEISRLVLENTGMFIYYCSDFVSLDAEIKIVMPNVAYTYCKDNPIRCGMHQSTKLYSPQKLRSVKNLLFYQMKEGLN